jgi:hypothetical protein
MTETPSNAWGDLVIRFLEKFGLPSLIIFLVMLWVHFSLWPAAERWISTLVDSHTNLIGVIETDLKFRSQLAERYSGEFEEMTEQLDRMEKLLREELTQSKTPETNPQVKHFRRKEAIQSVSQVRYPTYNVVLERR